MRRRTKIGIGTLVAVLAVAALTAIASAEEGFLPLVNKEVAWSSGKLILESTGGWSYQCKSSEGKGTFANDKHFTIEMHFNECTSAGFAMNSLGDKTGVVLFTALALVCLINSEKLTFGIIIELPSGGVHLEIPALGELLVLAGSYIGEVLTTGLAKSFVVDITGKAGKQNVVECKDGKEVKKGSLTSEPNENKKPEPASVNMESGSLKFSETKELMDT
jgi:hypothetical protein